MDQPLPRLRLALFEPDQPGNIGTLLRTAACFGVGVDIIEPCGFPFSDRSLRRSGMDYLAAVPRDHHTDFAAFDAARRSAGRRLLLLTTKSAAVYTDFAYQPDDILLFGRESVGVPDEVHAAADARLVVPMQPGMRSFNVAITAAMVLGEALRQTEGFYR
jgi:tRNA (cytidine/uridine-2'-O-)-methyltransferase